MKVGEGKEEKRKEGKEEGGMEWNGRVSGMLLGVVTKVEYEATCLQFII